MTTASEIPAGDSLTGGNFYWGKNVISVTPAGQRREELEAFLWRCGLSAAYVDAGLAAADRYAESLFLDLTGGENTSRNAGLARLNAATTDTARIQKPRQRGADGRYTRKETV